MMWLFSLGLSLDFVDSLASYANRFQVVGIRQQRHASGELTSAAQVAGLAMQSLLKFNSHASDTSQTLAALNFCISGHVL